MIAELQCVVLDCPDPVRLAGFYHHLLGGEVDRPDARWAVGDGWATLHTAAGPVLAFQRVADHRPPRWPDPAHPQQFHLDFGVPDLDAAQTRVVAAGATVLDDGAGSGAAVADLRGPGGASVLPGQARQRRGVTVPLTLSPAGWP